MDGRTEQHPVARLAIPTESTACGVIFVVLFVGFFVWLAVLNLLAPSTPLIGHVASILWLALVVFVLFVVISQVGVRMSAIEVLGGFSRQHFVEIRREGGRTVIGFGYQLLGRPLYYLQIEREWVVSVNMNTGQATHFAGKDMNDWHVVLWYRDPGAPPKPGPFSLDRELYLVGRAGPKATIAEFFEVFVAFLHGASIDLRPTEKDTEVCVPATGAPSITPPSPPSPSV